jgi:hypothetical protein
MNTEESAKKAVEGLTGYVNNYGASYKLFAQYLMNEHRTLQQSTMRLFIACIEEWSKQKYGDLRNEATLELSKKIMNALENENTHLPLI